MSDSNAGAFSGKVGFACLGSACPNTCCGPFHGTRALVALRSADELGEVIGTDASGESDVDLEVSIFAQIRLLEEDVQRLQEAGLEHMIVRRGSQIDPAYFLRLNSDGSCAALSEHKLCTIYQARPTLCRAFPFYFDLFAGLSMVESCPGVGAGESTLDELAGSIDAAIEMYEHWIGDAKQEAGP